MPEDNQNSNPNPNSNPTPPRPQPHVKSLDGFTNTPKPAGSPPTNNHNTLPSNSAPNMPLPGSSFGSGGISKPSVSGLPTMPIEPTPSNTAQGSAPVIVQKKSRKKLWIFLIALLVLLILGAGYVFAFYLPNTPNNVYKSSLENSGLALDKLIDYSRAQQQVHYKSMSFDGKLNVKSPSASFDSSITGAVSGSNGKVQAAGDFMGTHVKADVRYVTAKGNTSPDFYLQISGIKSTLNSLGLGSVAKLDSQWIVVDHTLLDTYKSSIQQMIQQSSGSDVANAKKSPTYAQVQDAITKVQTVNKQYIFTSDSTKAVLTNQQYVGKETVDGRVMYHYKVGYNKEHLQAYVTAVGQALDSSQLNDWSKQANSGKNLSEVMDIKSVNDQIKNAKSDYTFDMWVDKGTKLISKLAFTDTKDKNSVVTISQNYTGGVVYPFSVGFASKDSSGNPQTFTLGFNVNSDTHKVGITIKGNMKDSSGSTTVDGNLNFTPGNDPVTVIAPKHSTPVMDILKTLGLGSLLAPPQPVSGTTCKGAQPYSLTCLPLKQGTKITPVNPGGVIIPGSNCKPTAGQVCPGNTST